MQAAEQQRIDDQSGHDGAGRGASLTICVVEFAVAIVAGVLLVHRQTHMVSPLPPVDLLRIPVFTLSVATSLDQMELRRAVFSLSGELKTLDGTFALDEMGGQIGELTPLGQLVLDDHGHIKFVSIYPHETATGKPVYPAP